MLELNIFSSYFSWKKLSISHFLMKKQTLIDKNTLSDRKKLHSKKMSQLY